VELAGSGVGDYLTPILLDDSEALVAAIDNALSRVGLRIQFNDVPREAPWAAATHDMGRWQIRPSSACPVTSLPESPAAWQRALPSGLRRNLRRYRDRLQDDVDARFETIEHDEGPVPAAINALISLHTKRWRARGLPGVLDDERVRRFHMAAGPALMRSGVLRLHVLRGRSDVIGVQYVLVRGPRAYSYLAGFDPEWDSYSPGTLLMAHAIEHAITGGCTEFDFLRGREPYKYQWGAADRCSLSFSSDVIS
jgi:CelD/BcsL family acetyltransferase involved in cellulose biosynthesis